MHESHLVEVMSPSLNFTIEGLLTSTRPVRVGTEGSTAVRGFERVCIACVYSHAQYCPVVLCAMRAVVDTIGEEYNPSIDWPRM